MRTLLHGSLRGLLLAPLLVAGCGIAEDGLTWVQSLWSDEPEPSAASEPSATSEPEAGATPAGGTGTPSSASTSAASPEATGSTTGAASTTGDAGESTDGGSSSGGSTTLLMSLARPPTTGASDSGESSGATGGTTGEDSGTGGAESGTGGTTGGASGGATASGTSGTGTPSSPPPGGLMACLEGSWDVDDLATYFRHVVRGQAHGRSVRSLSHSGSYSVTFSGGKVTGKAKHYRMRYSARLADQDISYSVDVHGSFDSSAKIEGTDTLVVATAPSSTIRAKETVRFEGGKTTTRRPKVPAFGRFEAKCDAKSLELRPLGGRKRTPAIRFVRPPP